MGIALITGVISYVLLTLLAVQKQPSGFSGAEEYISSIGSLEGLKALPTFFNANEALGSIGIVILALAALCGIITGVIANYIALSRLVKSMSDDEMLPEWFGKIGKHNTPKNALIAITIISCIMPLFGRTAIGWIVDVTTIGATIVYVYTSLCAFIDGRRNKNRKAEAFGIIGAAVSIGFAVYYFMSNFWSDSKFATESYLIFAVWGILGILVFRILAQKDNQRRLGKTEIVWLSLMFIIMFVSLVWIRQTTISESDYISRDVSEFNTEKAMETGLNEDDEVVVATSDYIQERIKSFGDMVVTNIFIQMLLIATSLIIIFSIFSFVKKRERQIELEKMRAEEASRAKSVFLSNMSHDIRTPMNAITGYTALALNDDNLNESTREYLNKIDVSSRHLLSLINDILDMSRIESGKIELDYGEEDICKILDEVYCIFSNQMESKKINFKVDYSSVDDKLVICDKNRIIRVLLNLISNAFKFTPSGGEVKVSFSEIGKENNTAKYQLCVVDTGMGMSEEFLKRIFEPFEREHTKAVSNIQGTGLGMSITKGLVELMNGTISVESKLDEGSKFIIELPLEIVKSNASIMEKERLLEESEIDFNGMKVLVAEDNPINFEIANMLLQNEGFEVDGAENGKIAVEKITDSEPDRYDLILMDVKMPVMDGYEATKAIRAMADKRAEIPIIAMTANAFAEDVQEAKNAGMNGHIAKPIDVPQMLETIRKVLAKNKKIKFLF